MLSRTLLFASLAVLAVSLTPKEWDSIWDQAEKSCEHLKNFNETDDETLLSIDDVPKKAKCFVSCFFDKVGLTNGTEINHELYSGWLEEELENARNKEEIIASVKNCIHGIERNEKCKTAYDLYECFRKKYFV